MFSISFRKYHRKKENQLIYFHHQNVSSYRNTVLKQSVRVFALGYFLITFNEFLREQSTEVIE